MTLPRVGTYFSSCFILNLPNKEGTSVIHVLTNVRIIRMINSYGENR
jgi:hypothetical protein